MEKIKDFPGYDISNFGRIRSNLKGKTVILRPRLNRNGYQKVYLTNPEQRKNKFVHRLVLETFVGACPEGMEGSHIDGNKENNNLHNLNWESRTDNVRRRSDSKLKLSYLKASWIRLLLNKGWSVKKLCKEFEVTNPQIYRIKNNKQWKKSLCVPSCGKPIKYVEE